MPTLNLQYIPPPASAAQLFPNRAYVPLFRIRSGAIERFGDGALLRTCLKASTRWYRTHMSVGLAVGDEACANGRTKVVALRKVEFMRVRRVPLVLAAWGILVVGLLGAAPSIAAGHSDALGRPIASQRPVALLVDPQEKRVFFLSWRPDELMVFGYDGKLIQTKNIVFVSIALSGNGKTLYGSRNNGAVLALSTASLRLRYRVPPTPTICGGNLAVAAGRVWIYSTGCPAGQDPLGSFDPRHPKRGVRITAQRSAFPLTLDSGAAGARTLILSDQNSEPGLLEVGAVTAAGAIRITETKTDPDFVRAVSVDATAHPQFVLPIEELYSPDPPDSHGGVGIVSTTDLSRLRRREDTPTGAPFADYLSASGRYVFGDEQEGFDASRLEVWDRRSSRTSPVRIVKTGQMALLTATPGGSRAFAIEVSQDNFGHLHYHFNHFALHLSDR